MLAPEWVVQVLTERAQKRTRTDPQGGLFDDGAPRSRSVAMRWSAGTDACTTHDRRGGIDRSESLWHIALDLLEAGLTAVYVEAVLAARDVALGWNKFTGRGDAIERYHIITEKAAASVGSKRVTLNKPEPATWRCPGLLVANWMRAAEFAPIEDRGHRLVRLRPARRVGLLTEMDGKASRQARAYDHGDAGRDPCHARAVPGAHDTVHVAVADAEASSQVVSRSWRELGCSQRDVFHLSLYAHAAALGVARHHHRGDGAPARLVGARILVRRSSSASSPACSRDRESHSGAAMNVMQHAGWWLRTRASRRARSRRH